MGFLTRCKRPFLFAFLLHFCNMLFSFFLKTFLILFEKQQQQYTLPDLIVKRVLLSVQLLQNIQYQKSNILNYRRAHVIA